MPKKHLVPHKYNESPNPARTIIPQSEALRLAEPGWKGANYGPSEYAARREDHVPDEECSAAREWLRHVEAGRIGGRR